MGETFTLAPHSSVTFTGQFTGSASVDMTSLLGSSAFSQAYGSLDALGHVRSDNSQSQASKTAVASRLEPFA